VQSEAESDCQATKENAFGGVELWAGNEVAHRHVEIVGLEGDVIALPSGSKEGGDLYALFSCGADHAARIVLALANETMTLLPPNGSLHSFAESLVGAIRRFQGCEVFAGDLTLFAAFGYLEGGPAWISYFNSKPDSSQPDTA
jgi:hypothetical protein